MSKKLLSIDILVLDHTEVINGITAKYYKLTTENFSVAYENTPPSGGSLFDSTTNMLISVIDEFKNDIINSASYIKSHEEVVNVPRKGFITKESLHLDEENYEAFHEEMRLLYQKYRSSNVAPDSGEDTYDFFVGWVRKF